MCGYHFIDSCARNRSASCGGVDASMNIAPWLERAGKSHPDRPAAALGERVVLDYGALAARAARLAEALRTRCKLDSGDRVAIVAKNCVAYLETLYGTWHAGLAGVLVNAKLHGAEIGYILEHSGTRACFVSAGLDADIAPSAPKSLEQLIVIGSPDYERLFAADAISAVPRAADDLAWLFYTSGTTGRPKGAMLTHRVLSVLSHAYAAEVDPIAPGDAIVHAAPMSHGSGLTSWRTSRGSVSTSSRSPAASSPPRSFASSIDGPAPPCSRHRPWSSGSSRRAATATRTTFERSSGAARRCMSRMRCGDRFGPRLVQIYGQGESPMTIATLSKEDIGERGHPRWQARLASAGRPFACVEVIVADSDDRALPAGETGEILCRGDVVMAGYWQDPQASAATLRNGWLHTGDLGAFDADGYLTLKDRSKDVIISGGSNIYPREVEEVLLRLPRVRAVSVVGRADREWGEVVVAYMVGDASAGELDRLCLDAIARFKRPKDYVFIDALPKNNYGKILKTELRAMDAKRISADRQ